MTPQTFSDDLVLAALDRAVRHSAKGTYVSTSEITWHLAISARSGAWRQVRGQLRGLVSAGAVEHTRRHGMPVWGLTNIGRERVRRIEVVLSESPQHRAWREASTAAAREIDHFLLCVRGALDEATQLLDADPAAVSDAWFELGERLGRDCRSVGSATYCLREWAEPDDARADVDDRRDPADERFDPDERAKRRLRRMGRRNVRLWDASAARDAVTSEEHRWLIGLGRAIGQLRAEQNISAGELAVAAGLTRRRLDAIEAGRFDPPFDVLLALARGLNVKPAELAGRAETETATAQRSLPNVARLHSGTLRIGDVLMRWRIDAQVDPILTLTPVNVLDRKALEDATMNAERILDEHVSKRSVGERELPGRLHRGAHRPR
jgi:transcriptional regulator with XRE-family HTH domain